MSTWDIHATNSHAGAANEVQRDCWSPAVEDQCRMEPLKRHEGKDCARAQLGDSGGEHGESTPVKC